jgi:hypothetical protein
MNTPSFAKAVYVKTGMPQYDGNPLIECLPAILTDIDVVRCIGNCHPSQLLRSLNLAQNSAGTV